MITSLENSKVKAWTKLHNKKYREEEFLLLDESLVYEAFKHHRLKTLIYINKEPFKFDESYEVSKEVMLKITKGLDLNYIGIGLQVEEKRNYDSRVMILEDLQDPLNVGRIINNAYIFGFDSVILSKTSADIYNTKCIKEMSKALYNINIIRADIDEEINKLKEEGFKIYSTGLKDYSIEMYDVKNHNKMAFILGNEGSGVKEETMKNSDEIIKIDMHNIDSLNVAMAGAILMYRFRI